MSDSEIKIVKSLRECKHNEDCKARGEKRGFIYDYAVVDGGKVVATFKRTGWKNSWELYDNGLQTVKVLKPNGFKHRLQAVNAPSVALMLKAYLEAKIENAIPTDADIENRKAEAEQKAKELEALHKEQDRLYNISQASEDLYKAAKKLLEDKDRSAANAHLDFEPLREAVFKAENPRSAEG